MVRRTDTRCDGTPISLAIRTQVDKSLETPVDEKGAIPDNRYLLVSPIPLCLLYEDIQLCPILLQKLTIGLSEIPACT